MSLLELKQEIARLSPPERRELNAYLTRLRNESEEGQHALNQLMTDMDQGKKTSMSELEARLQDHHGERL